MSPVVLTVSDPSFLNVINIRGAYKSSSPYFILRAPRVPDRSVISVVAFCRVKSNFETARVKSVTNPRLNIPRESEIIKIPRDRV